MATAPGEIKAILRRIGAPLTPQNIEAFSAWARAEGGSAAYNPFNTTQSAPGAGSYNSVGVRSYTSKQQGINATVQTLQNGRYGAILQALQAGNNAGAVAQAVGASPWGTSGSLMASIIRGDGGKVGKIPSAPGAGLEATSAGSTHATHFDAHQFKVQTGMLLLQDAAAKAQGIAPPTDLLQGMEAIRKAATMKVDNAAGAGGIPVAGGAGGLGGRVAAVAGRQVGTPYVWGGESKAGFDCSGLVQFAYGKLGIKLPRTAAEQGQAGRAVSYKNLKPGDLLVENNGDHVVMYAGNGKVVAAPHTGTNVQYQPLNYFPSSQYYARRIVG